MAPPVSLCMIVKNEEANLPACLAAAADLVQEIVVVDTGSTDRTKEAASRFGARIVDFPWVDNFSAARNESLRHATCPWIFWLDADDRVDEENRGRVRTLFSGLRDENVVYMMCCYSKPATASGSAMMVDHARLFRNHPDIRWQYRVHEQITLAVEKLGGSMRRTDVMIHHSGYQDQALRRRKNERNLRLLQLEYTEKPNDVVILFHLGWTHLDLGRGAEALPFLLRSLELSPPGLSNTRKIYALLMNTYYSVGQVQQALAAVRQGRRWFPDDPELLFGEGKLAAESSDLGCAESCFTRLLTMGTASSCNAVDAGVVGHLAHFHLGEVYARQGRSADAEANWRRVLALRPDYTNAWLRLGDLWGRQGRGAEIAQLEQAAARLEASGTDAEDVLLLRVQAQMGRKDFAAARQLTTAAVARNPQSLTPRILLSQVLLQEGRDWDAAERALHDILALDPKNIDARHNLAVLAQVRMSQRHA